MEEGFFRCTYLIPTHGGLHRRCFSFLFYLCCFYLFLFFTYAGGFLGALEFAFLDLDLDLDF